MDDKYLVQFVTLLGGACVSILMAYRVYTEQVGIVYALLVLFFAEALFFILGRIVRKVLNNIKIENVERERKEREEMQKASEKRKEEESSETTDAEASEAEV